MKNRLMAGGAGGIRIEKAGVRHLPGLYRVYHEAKVEGGRSPLDPFGHINSARFAIRDTGGLSGRGWRSTYVLMDGKRIVGTARVTEPMTARYGEGGAKSVTASHLSGLWVHPDYQGRGLSSRLVDHVLAQHPDMPMILATGNEKLLNSLPRRGFEPLGKVAGGGREFRHPESMEKPLFIWRPRELK